MVSAATETRSRSFQVHPGREEDFGDGGGRVVDGKHEPPGKDPRDGHHRAVDLDGAPYDGGIPAPPPLPGGISQENRRDAISSLLPGDRSPRLRADAENGEDIARDPSSADLLRVLHGGEGGGPPPVQSHVLKGAVLLMEELELRDRQP